MEWHYKNSPYMYCFDNPMKYIDPTGLEGNWFTNLFKKAVNFITGNVFLNSNEGGTKPTQIPEVVVKAKGTPRNDKSNKITAFLFNLDDMLTGPGSSQPDGWILTTKKKSSNGPGVHATKSKDPTETPSDLLLLLIGNAGAGTLETGGLDPAEAADAAKDVIEENADTNNSDTPPGNDGKPKKKYETFDQLPEGYKIPSKPKDIYHHKGDKYELDSFMNGPNYFNKYYKLVK